MSDQLRFEGQVAVVTGAGRGLGRAYALALAERGARVVINDVGGTITGENASAEPADQVVAEIVAAGGEAIASQHDVSDPIESAALIDAALDGFGRVDVVVANAGIMIRERDFADTELSVFERMWRVHFGGTFNVIRAAWPHLVEQRYGRIITISSPAGIYGVARAAEYASAKGAIQSFTLSLAPEAAEHGIKANVVAPVAFTRMVTEFAVIGEDAQRAIARLAAPEMVSPAVVWLAHESCPCNGGLFEVGARRFARVAIGGAVGYSTADPSPEDLDAHADEVQSRDEPQFFIGALEHAEWLLTQAGEREAHT